MRIAFVLAVAAIAATPVAAEAARAEICVKGDDRRVIEISTPGNVGAACDVVYRRSASAEASVPYFANADANYCITKAAELAGNLAEQGYSCTREDLTSVEAALDGAAEAPPAVRDDESLDAQLAGILSEQSAQSADSANEAPLVASAPEYAEPQAVQPEPQPAATIATTQTLSQPAPQEAPQIATVVEPVPAEPVQLASDVKPSEFRAPEPPKSSGPGRLVGAQPSLDDIDDIIDESAKPIVTADAAIETAAAANEKGVPARSTEDLIRNIFAANAAAWNEGNLDAYMRGYVNSAGVVYIEDAIVTAGWGPLRKSFEKEISSAGEMGRLTFADLNVRMTTDNVATVVGKYSLARSQSSESGVVSIVMNQVEGRWRISQETRIPSARATD